LKQRMIIILLSAATLGLVLLAVVSALLLVPGGAGGLSPSRAHYLTFDLTRQPGAIVFTVTNSSENEVKLTFHDGERYRLIVTAGDELVYNSSQDKAFSQQVSHVQLQPGEELRFEEAWEFPRAGRYRVQAFLTALSDREPVCTTEWQVDATGITGGGSPALEQGTVEQGQAATGLGADLPAYLPEGAVLLGASWERRGDGSLLWVDYRVGDLCFSVGKSRAVEGWVPEDRVSPEVSIHEQPTDFTRLSPEPGDTVSRSWYSLRWTESGSSYLVQGDLPERELLKIADSIGK